ncbi:sensor histidine kinase [Methanofollis fontis]|nr:histidine kinase dimerization/phosphoacceptor domain -containing protein [Methanofollis fontis]
MTEYTPHDAVINSISVLYELSLSVGNSLDLQENCRIFLSALLARKNYSFASVWVFDGEKPEEGEISASLRYANPDFRVKERSLPADSRITSLVSHNMPVTIRSKDPLFSEICTENGITDGSYALFPLGTIGFLKLHSTKSTGVFSAVELRQLGMVMAKFATSLAGCCAHERVLQEIAERKKAERMLHLSEQRYHTIFDHAFDGLVVFDPRTMIVLLANPASLRMYGLPFSKDGFEIEREKIEFNILAFISPEYRDRIISLIQSIQVSGQDQFAESIRTIRPDGEEIWINVAGTKMEYHGKMAILASIRDVSERKQYEDRLQMSLNEKTALLKEVHHRVKNNMQIVSSLLRLQSRLIEDEKTLGYFRDAESRIMAMALVHEKLYRSETMAYVNLKDYASTLAEELIRAHAVHTMIDLETEIETIHVDLDSAIPIGLIINEIVINSIKHAFHSQDHGTISLKIHSTPNRHVAMIISDNGCGMPDPALFQKSQSLGIRLITILVKQLHGSITIDGGCGTRHQITLIPHVLEEGIGVQNPDDRCCEALER